MIEIKQLQYFTVCAREGSFSKAAEVLYTTQPNVSRVIRDMETELGFTLFQRKGRGIFLTKEGERVGRFAERILRSADMLHAMTESTRIDYFCLASVSGRSIAHQFSNFCDRHFESEIVCKYVEGDVDFVVKQVENYLAELGFVYVSAKQLPDFKYILYRKHMVFNEIDRTSVAVSFSAGTTFDGKTEVGVEDLKGVRFIRTAEDQFSLENNLVHLFNDPDLQKAFDKAIVTNSGHAMAQMLRELPGLCHLNTLKPEGEQHRGGIMTLPIVGCENSLIFGYISRENEELSEYAKEFLSGFEKNKPEEE